MPASPDDRLDSWKEIATYVGRGVRTVRRWEREEGLPVHRQMHRVLGSVYAFRSEIDQWRQTGRRRADPTAREASAIDSKSIAVLPFTNLSTEQDHEYFSDGLTAEVIADLSRVRTLRVISRNSSMRFRDTPRDVKGVAHDLGVRYILDGTVRRSGARLRITAELIDAVTDEHLWAEKYDGTLDDVFAIQERLARLIVEALQIRLSAEEDHSLKERPIADLRAWDRFLRARQEAWRWRHDSIDRAVELLREALTITGDNALLYAALGRAFLQYREAGIDFGEAPLAEAEACARSVFALEPESTSGRQLRGFIHYARGEIQEAVVNLKAALAADSADPDTLLLLSNCYLISGRVAAARPLITRLLAIDPLTPLARCMPAWADVLEGNSAAAIEPYREMFEMDRANPMARLFYVWVLAVTGRKDSVTEVVEEFPPEMRESVPARIAFFLADALAGKGSAARAQLERDIDPAMSATDVFPRLLAYGYALAGEPERAIDWLETAVERGFINYPYLAEHDPFPTGMRNHPRFVALLDRVRERWERFEA